MENFVNGDFIVFLSSLINLKASPPIISIISSAMPMHKHKVSVHLLSFQALVFFLSIFIHFSHCDVGTASHYGPPFLPCYGKDASEFPSSNMFASAGEGIWDNGAACGRQYQVRCISAAAPRTCIPGQLIQIKIVDRAQSTVSRPSRAGTSMVLSTTAFQAIANASASLINIEFQQV
ncbi:putative EG45-like domain containing protein 1 isoform X2 [Arachis hypogaea]|uniref:putative EG45-like domain containing protein 1 isoform X2 n=2 Tax=Arachis TaxID=3817 RepID=UPI000DECE1AF|nr:putative EG45-like domain containing protein 1 isoform X2 [Arachis hypogaea]